MPLQTNANLARMSSRVRTLFWAAALVVALAGAALRIVPSAGFKGTGFDEALYRRYVLLMDGGQQVVRVPNRDMRTATSYEIKAESRDLAAMPDLCAFYISSQSKPEAMCELPPTRFLYIFCGWLWKRAEFGEAPPVDLKSTGGASRDPALISLHRVSSLFAVLTMLAGGVAAGRMLGRWQGLGVMTLLAAAPVALHMSQHALIDGFFAFWATLCLWLLWENLRAPAHPGRLVAYGAALALMVATKENSFFVFCALTALLVINRWINFGTISPRLLAFHFAGPAVGVLLLVALAGGAGVFIEIYKLLVSKAQNLPYAIATGDGPWHRYLVDMLLVSPVVVILALGGAFTSLRQNRSLAYLACFVAFSYAIMCNVRYGMNLRYSTIWDVPIHALAFAQLTVLTRSLGEKANLALTVAVAAVSAYGLRQYVVLSVDHGMYEMVTEGLLRALQIMK